MVVLNAAGRIVLGGLVAALFSSECFAQFNIRQQPQRRTAEQLTSIRVLADTQHLTPGEQFHIVVAFDIEPKWHLYWKNSGEGAMPPQINVTAPEGFTVGKVRWPRPIIIPSPVGDMYCYEDQFALFVPVTAPAEIDASNVQFDASITWAVCDKDMCLVGTTRRSVNLATDQSGSLEESSEAGIDPLIALHRQRLSSDVADREDAHAEHDGSTLRISGPAHGRKRAVFIPLESPGVTYGSPRITIDEDRFEVTVEMTVNENNFLSGPPAVGGLVALGDELNDPSYEASMPLSR